MYVCLCKGITDSQIRRAVADGVTHYRDLRQALGVASQCGKCGILAREIFQECCAGSSDSALFYPAAAMA
jgi:bacterioferritin-associated ferredoxin